VLLRHFDTLVAKILRVKTCTNMVLSFSKSISVVGVFLLFFFLVFVLLINIALLFLPLCPL